MCLKYCKDAPVLIFIILCKINPHNLKIVYWIVRFQPHCTETTRKLATNLYRNVSTVIMNAVSDGGKGRTVNLIWWLFLNVLELILWVILPQKLQMKVVQIQPYLTGFQRLPLKSASRLQQLAVQSTDANFQEFLSLSRWQWVFCGWNNC